MKTTAITFLCLILIMATQSFAQGQSSLSASESSEKKRFSAEWRLSMAGTDNQDLQTQSKYVDLRLEVKSKYILTSSMFLDLQPAVRLVSGQAQTMDGADKMENKILLNQAAVHYTPASFFRLSAGALDQRYAHTSLLIDKMAFPGARVEAKLRAGDTETSLVGATSIPTSTSLSTNTNEKEATPSLNSGALKFYYVPTRDAFWSTTVGYFMYNNLPSAVAKESMLLGNEVNTLSEADYEFVNKYEGVEAGTYLRLPVGSLLHVSLVGEYLKNLKAEDDVNTATMYSAGASVHMTGNLDLNLMGGYFSVAPEAAVAYFNARGFETNRQGYFGETGLSFRKEGFNVGVRYTDSEVMFTNSIQSREKTIMIKLETFYANI
ncbi:MAG: hypothetical protein J7501_02285 [Bdellovibrio sp.]|nr:hypothetical protein [Bdellovibrio sp.]